MHNIRAIRENPKKFDKNWKRHGLAPQTVTLLGLDTKIRSLKTTVQDLQQKRNELSKKIGVMKRESEDSTVLEQEVATIKTRMTEGDAEEKKASDLLYEHLGSLPNLMDDDVPEGASDADNIEIRQWGTPKTEKVPEHFDIGEALGMMDFETAAKMSGSRFVLLHSGLARMERALAQFMLDTHTQDHGCMEVSPPLMVRTETMFGTGQLPKFEEEQFQTTRGDWLIPTAEVPLTNIVANMILDEDCLPRRYVGFTPNFRQEAGAAGKDTRGMIRQHQFYKVEMVSIVHPDESIAEQERMVGCAETILKKLEIPFRIMLICQGDTGFGARKTYDLEVWLPGQNRYREISSCSNCGDFQARRMKARFRKKGEKDIQFVHTLNGSGVAVGRALIAVLENYYDPADGGVFVPEVLKPYMGGLEKLTKIDKTSSMALTS